MEISEYGTPAMIKNAWAEHLATLAPPLTHDTWYFVIVYSQISGWYVTDCLVLASAIESKWDAEIPVRYVRRIHGVITTEVRRDRIFYTKKEAEEYLSVIKNKTK